MWLKFTFFCFFVILPTIFTQNIDYSVPYHAELTEPFKPGQTLIVKGKTAEDSVNFTVSFHIDFKGKNDIPLQVAVLFDKGKILLNSRSRGKWGEEEKQSNPWKPGDDYDLRIRAHDKKFQIFVNQKQTAEYVHRLPVLKISHISVDGDVYVTQLNLTGAYYPIPYDSKLPKERLKPGKTLLIYGIPEKKATSFYVNILKKNGDIAFQLKPNFAEKAVIRNSFLSNKWGPEEREGKNMIFERGTGFDLEIQIESFAYQIFINGQRFTSFAHRTKPEDFSNIQIGGDVEIYNLQSVDNNSLKPN